MIVQLFLLFIFLFGFSNDSIAAYCDISVAGQCGQTAGCEIGDRCQIWGETFQCRPDPSCISNPTPSIPPIITPTPPPSISCNYNTSDVACKSASTGASCTQSGSTGTCTAYPNTGNPYVDTRCFCNIGSGSGPGGGSGSGSTTPLPTPTPIVPTDKECKDIEIDGQKLGSYDTVYPPNSLCYKKVTWVHTQLDNYPLSCTPVDTVKYEATYFGLNPPDSVDVTVISDFTDAELGSWGPNHSLVTQGTNGDDLASKYIFNALFDRPVVSPLKKETINPREAFRSFWRMLSAFEQANFKAWYFAQVDSGNFTNTYYSFIDETGETHNTNAKKLAGSLPACLKKYPACTDFGDAYMSLDPLTRAAYDALLPFNFDNVRGYGVMVKTLTKENLPYLAAMLSGTMSTVGLFSHYTPGGFIKTTDNPDGFIENQDTLGLALPAIITDDTTPYKLRVIKKGAISNCSAPEKSYGLASPRTYPFDDSALTQVVTVPVQAEQESVFGGIIKWKLTGTAKAKPIAILNNPLVAKINKRVYSNPQESFYHMLTPQDVASKVAEQLIKAPKITHSARPNASVDANPNIFRVTNLPQDAMHVLQNCQFMPKSLAKSPVCGSTKEASCGAPPPPFTFNPVCRAQNTLNLPQNLLMAIEEAGNAYQVPPALIIAVLYGEGTFNPGSPLFDAAFVDEHMKSCAEIPGCDPNGTSIIFNMFKTNWDKSYGEAVTVFDPNREPNPCNVLDGVFAVAKQLRAGKTGSPFFKNPATGSAYSCFGIPLNTGASSSTSVSCSDWTDSDVESSIRTWEFGTGYNATDLSCATKENSCLLGGGLNAQCPTGDDTCETSSNRFGGASHNGCLWDIYQENN